METLSKVFSYKGSAITFNKNGAVMVNATEMAKPFGKRPVDWLQNQQSKEFINALAEVRNSTTADLVRVTKGGNDKKQSRYLGARRCRVRVCPLA